MPEGTLNPSNRKEFNRQLIEEFRANGGKVTGQFANRPLLLLTSTGAKAGAPIPPRWCTRRTATAWW